MGFSVYKLCFWWFFLYSQFAYTCARNRFNIIRTDGLKSGPVYVRRGDYLDLLCTGEKENSSQHLEFIVGGDILEHEKINSTTIKLHKLEENDFLERPYYCRDMQNERNEIISIVVANSPSDVKDFTCISNNFEELNCSWTTPLLCVNTTYSVYLVSNKSTKNVIYSKTVTPKAVSQNMSCNWRPEEIQERYFQIVIDSNNTFGQNKKIFNIDHYAVVKPHQPEELEITQQNPDKLTLHWKLHDKLIKVLNNKTDIQYKLEYKFMNELPRYKNIKRPLQKINSCTMALPYFHMNYTLRLYIKVIEGTEGYWSSYSEINFNTSSATPRNPIMPVGAFIQQETTQWSNCINRIIWVYWEKIEKYEEAGENFMYKVIEEHDSKINTYNIDKKKSYAKLKSESCEAIHFTIFSSNDKGSSINRSNLIIPSAVNTRSLSVNDLTCFVTNTGEYELTWHPDSNVDNYTIFWCQDQNFKSCTGSLNFHVLNNDYKGNFKKPLLNGHSYQFAIAANKGQITSGMIEFEDCLSEETISLHNYGAQLEAEQINKTFIKLIWSLHPLIKKHYTTGYDISFCQSGKKENVTTLSISNPNQTRIKIENLSPYQSYQFKLAVYTVHGVKYDTLNVTTKEDVPTNPRNLKIQNSRNDYLEVHWDPPLNLNGDPTKIKYKVTCKTKFNGKECSSPKHNGTSAKFFNLTAYTDYLISVKACNMLEEVICSDLSNITAKTKVGVSSAPQHVSLLHGILSWTAPEFPGGPLNLQQYEIKIVTDNITETLNLTALQYSVNPCEGTRKRKYQVRAINIDSDHENITYKSTWSREFLDSCYTFTNLLWLYISIGLLTTIGIAFSLVKLYKSWKVEPKFHETICHPYPKFNIPRIDESKNIDFGGKKHVYEGLLSNIDHFESSILKTNHQHQRDTTEISMTKSIITNDNDSEPKLTSNNEIVIRGGLSNHKSYIQLPTNSEQELVSLTTSKSTTHKKNGYRSLQNLKELKPILHTANCAEQIITNTNNAKIKSKSNSDLLKSYIKLQSTDDDNSISNTLEQNVDKIENKYKLPLSHKQTSNGYMSVQNAMRKHFRNNLPKNKENNMPDHLIEEENNRTSKTNIKDTKHEPTLCNSINSDGNEFEHLEFARLSNHKSYIQLPTNFDQELLSLKTSEPRTHNTNGYTSLQNIKELKPILHTENCAEQIITNTDNAKIKSNSNSDLLKSYIILKSADDDNTISDTLEQNVDKIECKYKLPLSHKQISNGYMSVQNAMRKHFRNSLPKNKENMPHHLIEDENNTTSKSNIKDTKHERTFCDSVNSDANESEHIARAKTSENYEPNKDKSKPKLTPQKDNTISNEINDPCSYLHLEFSTGLDQK